MATGGTRTQTAVLKEEFSGLWSFSVGLIFDTFKNLLILGALSAIFVVTRWLKNQGMEEGDIRHIQDLHFWLTYGALAWIGIVFIVKLVKRGVE